MNTIQPYAKLLDITNREEGVKLLQKIEWCGRISHRSEESQTDTSWERFIKAVVLDHGDWSIVEHASVTCDFYVDRGITHEIVRHRLFSFTQESTRFVNYEKKMPPSFIRPLMGGESTTIWNEFITVCESSYRSLIKAGIPPQIARSVFPNALASRIVITGNLRNWRHFFIMRTIKETHPQMKEVTIPLLEEFKGKIPIIFDDIEPNMKQSESMKRMR